MGEGNTLTDLGQKHAKGMEPDPKESGDGSFWAFDDMGPNTTPKGMGLRGNKK